MGFDEPPKGVEDSATLCNCFLPDVKLSFWVQTQSASEIMGGKACWGSGGGEEGRKTKWSHVCVCVCVRAHMRWTSWCSFRGQNRPQQSEMHPWGCAHLSPGAPIARVTPTPPCGYEPTFEESFRPEFESTLQHSLAGWTWASPLTLIILSFLICKMELITAEWTISWHLAVTG